MNVPMEPAVYKVAKYPRFSVVVRGDQIEILRTWNGSTVVCQQRINKDGYLYVWYSENRRSRQVLVHRLVLEAVIGPASPGQITRHLDGNRTNNSPSNLKWGTYKENAEDAARHGTVSKGKGKLTPNNVVDIKSELIRKRTCAELARRFCVCEKTILEIKSGKTWRHITV